MSKTANTLENFILRHGEELGKQKWNEYLEKLKKRPKAKNPNSKKDWKPIDLIKNYDKKKTINLENITDEFLEKFQEKWNTLRTENPKIDAVQLYSKTIKSLFTAKSQIKKEYWLQRFWSKAEAEEKTNSKRETQIANEDWYVKKYGVEKGKKLWKEKCESSNLLENWTKKFGEEKAQEMYDEYREKLSKAKSLKGYQDKYGNDIGEQLWNEWLSKQGRNESFYIDRYGEQDGKSKWKEILAAQKYYSTLEGMIDRYGEEEGGERYSKWYESTKKGKDYFIKRYGVSAGLEFWNDLNIRRVSTWKEKATLDSFKERYGIEDGTEKWVAWKTFSGNYSKNSFSLFSRIVEEYPEFRNASFGENEAVIDFQDSDISKDFVKPDFLWNNKIIEFNGTYWHRDPRFFDNTIENQNIRKRDNERINELRKKGYETKVVWEIDYENNPFKLLDDCVNFLKK